MKSVDRAVHAVLRRLAIRGTVIRRSDDGAYRLVSTAAEARGARLDPGLVAELLSRGLLVETNEALEISAAGKAALRRRMSLGATEDFATQHRSMVVTTIEHESGRETVAVNQAESPLAWLRRRKGRDGKPLLDIAQFQAGERLRADFTRARLTPRVTANWDAAVASGRRSGDGNGLADLTDAVVAARLRVERAIEAVGPEFGSVLLDFCCFLKGIEDIERARRWPVRSAKLVLQLALTSLARHYGIAPTASAAPSRGRVRHWGTDDYRPKIV